MRYKTARGNKALKQVLEVIDPAGASGYKTARGNKALKQAKKSILLKARTTLQNRTR